MFTTYTMAAFIHVCGMLIYQNTGEPLYLSLSGIMIAWSLLMFILGVAAHISPELKVDIDDEDYMVLSDYTGRGTLQITVGLIAYALYIEGYAFLSGIIALQAVVVFCSCMVSIWVQGKVNQK